LGEDAVPTKLHGENRKFGGGNKESLGGEKKRTRFRLKDEDVDSLEGMQEKKRKLWGGRCALGGGVSGLPPDSSKGRHYSQSTVQK